MTSCTGTGLFDCKGGLGEKQDVNPDNSFRDTTGSYHAGPLRNRFEHGIQKNKPFRFFRCPFYSGSITYLRLVIHNKA